MLAALVCVPGSSYAAARARLAAPPVRIMLVGDSITQGSEGDWTWRYRLWQHLTSHAVDVDLVGPRDDLRDEIGHTFGSQAYLDPAFDRDHASRWGMLLGDLDVPVGTLITDHEPDVVVALLGDNDLSEGVPPDDVIELLRDFVGDARAVDPAVEVVLVTDPRPHLTPGAETYNDDVAALVDELDTDTSPVALADAAAGYDENEDTYDGAHPNSHGELKIAAAVEDALSELGVGPPADRPLPLDTTPRGPRVAPVLSVTPEPHGARLSWVRSPGAQTSEVWQRDLTAGTPWQQVADEVSGTTYDVTGLATGHHVQLQTRPLKGFWVAQPDAWSEAVDVVVPPPGRVMLLGDSGTIGSTGDWTWRYRLWKHLTATAGPGVDLVGPRNDLYDRATRTNGHQQYVDPAFDRDHAGTWGTGAAFPVAPVDQLVRSYDVQTLVEMLGVNDLQLLGLPPQSVADEVRGLVEDARAANPDVDVVLGEVTQTWVAGAPDLNARLHEIAAELDSPAARVVVAETADGLDREQDTYDNSHANARGEVKIAAAVADALAATGLGSTYARPLPSVPVGPRLPVLLTGEARKGRVVLRWNSSPGADDYCVLVRRGHRARWHQAAQTSRHRVTLRGLVTGERYRFVVLPRKGRDLAAMDVRSNPVRVRLSSP